MKHIDSYIHWVFLALFVCYSSLCWGGGGSSHSKHYVKVEAKAQGPTGAGMVYVGQRQPSSDADYAVGTKSTEYNCSGVADNDKPTFYFAAQDITNWLWIGWYDGSTEKNTALQYSESVDISNSSTKEGSPTSVIRTATWVQPKVLNASDLTLSPITDPNQPAVSGNIVFTLQDDRGESNFISNAGDINNITGFQTGTTAWSNGRYSLPISYTPSGIAGTFTAVATLTSRYGGSTQSATVSVTEDYTPRYTRPSDFTFAQVSTIGNAVLTGSATDLNYAAENGQWSAWIEGEDAAYFSIAGSISDGKIHPESGICEVRFTPRDGERAYSAVLHLSCIYTDQAGKTLNSTTEDIQLTGTGYIPQETTLSITPNSANPGNAGSTANGIAYTYPAQYGTVKRAADFNVGYTYMSTPTYTWTGNDAGIFSMEAKEPQATGAAYAQSLTIYAQTTEAVETETTYTATLTISGNSTLDENISITQTIQIEATIFPKKKNTLAWALDVYNASSYVLYTDQMNHPAFKDRNNTTTPIVFSSSQKDLANYIQIDTAACTLSPKLAANSRNLKAVQAESDEYEEAALTATIHVRKHELAWTYPQTDWARGTGQRLYRNTYYANILSTNSIDAGEATGFSEFRYNGTEPALGQKLIDHGNGTYGIETGDLTGNLPFVVNIPETENYYGRANTTGTAVTFYIIKDPIHVPVSIGTVAKFTSSAHTNEWYGLWLNNGYDMYGSTFKVSEYKATWIGYDWDNTNKQWTGTNTGRTDWTTVANQGSTNAFALENGGYVVFQFRGVLMYTSFGMYFNTATSDGTIKVEESTDGITWTETAQANTSATYLSTAGSKGVYIKGTSHYIRFSYSGINHAVITNTYLQVENNFVRTNFTANSTAKELADAHSHELTRNSDGTWNTFNFKLQIANWGKEGIQHTIDNPDFELFYTQPVSTGLDEYQEIDASIRYKGNKYFDQGTIKLFTRHFYSKTTSDTLRSLTFTISAVGTGMAMPKQITDATKTTTYVTGTVGPLRNSATNLQETSYSYSTTRGDNPHTGLNEQDFTSCFDSDGTALFDYLYIFGETTNNDGSFETYDYWYKTTEGDTLKARGTFPKIITANTGTPSNAVTPCYIYKKTNNTYTLEQTIPNMNVADKPIPTFTNDGKYYFSGFCPSASTGYRQSEIGILHFLGSGSSKMDVYLENCTLMSRGKTADGHIPVVADAQSESLNKFVQGSGAVLAFQSTSNNSASPFRPNIHIKGENYLRSSTGTYIKVNVVIKTMTASNNSSPIHVYTTSTKECTVLNIDDIWCNNDTPHTNGALYLRRINDNSPSIDLGNENTILYFKGGRISLKNAYPVSTNYTTTQAISWRYVEQYGAKLYGMGSDQNGGQVYFQDGTISSVPLNLGSDYADKYRDAISLKCPENTYIDGGTYECSLWACPEPSNLGESPKNSAGSPLTKWEMPVKATDAATGLVSIDFPGDLLNEDETDTEYYGQTLNYYYQSKGLEYGTQSLSANDTGYVVLMLPAQYTGKEAVSDTEIIPWAFTSPAITPKTAMVDVTLGGNTTVASGANTRTDYLLWTQIDNETKKAGTSSKYTTPVLTDKDIAVSISIADDSYGEILNTDDYSIAKKLYLLLPVQADQWFSMTAPFDISHIYVMNTYPDSELQKETRQRALELQGTANMDLAYFVGNGISGMGTGTKDLDAYTTNFWQYGYQQDTLSGAYPKDANTRMVNGVATPYYPSYYTQAKGYSTDYRGQNELVWFDGTNAANANFFLYHSANKTWTYDGTNFHTDWEYIQPLTKVFDEKEQPVIMQQGEIYALSFPYCPGCDDAVTRTYFDYWTGKFILFEGYGPQTLYGKSAQADQQIPFETANQGVLRGNMTLADMQLSTANLENVFFQTFGKNIFEPIGTSVNMQTIAPTSVFLLANPNTRNLGKIASIHVKNGIATYSGGETTSIPTISKGRTLFATGNKSSMTITVLKPQPVRVYSASGQLLATQYVENEMHMAVPQGMYLVRGEKEETKVIVP